MTVRAKVLLVVAILACVTAPAALAHPANVTLAYGEVNWDRGFVRISAVGLPPFGSTGTPADENVARENAVSAAQKRLLGVLLDLDTAHGGKLRDCVQRRPGVKNRLRQLVYAAGVQGKTYSDGAVEVTLTVSLAGTNGLQSLLDSL